MGEKERERVDMKEGTDMQSRSEMNKKEEEGRGGKGERIKEIASNMEAKEEKEREEKGFKR